MRSQLVCVCLTGGIATGKSLVTRILADFGDTVTVDCDQVVHDIMAEPEWITRLVAVFGSDIVDSDHKIDRRRLREVVFPDEALRHKLEAIVHPEVRRRCALARQSAEADPLCRLWVAEVPLLYESGFDLPRDYEMVVATSPATQRARLRNLRGLDDELSELIMAAQWPIMDKVRRAHLVIWNEGSIPCLKRQVLCLRRRLGLPL